MSVYRYNRRLDSFTESYNLEIPISEVKANFNILTSDGNELNIFKDTTKIVEFNPGDKISLINKSKGAETYLWTLQLQYFLGYEVDGTQTSIKDPSCYLYNAGMNKLRLTAKNDDGCSHTITANNIYVNNMASNLQIRHSAFATEEGEYPSLNADCDEVFAYPTLITDEVEYININSDEEEVLFAIYDTQSNLILQGRNSYSFQIKLPFMGKGMYILELNGKYIKIIRL